jgi:hypothetical protein
MTSSTTTPTNNQSNNTNNETAVYEYMRQFVDYQENGIDLNEVSQIRQLDIYLQSISSNFLNNFFKYFVLQIVIIVFENLLIIYVINNKNL